MSKKDETRRKGFDYGEEEYGYGAPGYEDYGMSNLTKLFLSLLPYVVLGYIGTKVVMWLW